MLMMLPLNKFYTTLAINTVDGHGLGNEAYHELLPKKTKVIQTRNQTFPEGVLSLAVTQ